MGLPAALEAHRKGDIKEAARHYKRALDQKDYQAVLFQNYGAILRELGSSAEAEKIYNLGLLKFPKHRGISQNLANLLRSRSTFKAFHIYLDLIHDRLKNSPSKLLISEVIPIIEILEELHFLHWAYEICYWLLSEIGSHPALLLQIFKIISRDDFELIDGAQQRALIAELENHVLSFSNIEKAEYYFAKLALQLSRSQIEDSLQTLSQARSSINSVNPQNEDERLKITKLTNQNSWNMGCILLSHQFFSDGWKLFEYGLRTKAAGAQKWQRAMPKPFTSLECKLWRGESLQGKSLLLLEEQAIGDVMQFLTLVPSLLDEVGKLGILINNRLFGLYKRSLKHWIQQGRISLYSFDDVVNGTLCSSNYNFQIPMGSVCQFRFTDISKFGNSFPLLKPDNSLRDRLAINYRHNSSTDTFRKVVGISWRGGGRADRIKQKSIDIDLFGDFLLSIPGVKFVCLQYGDVVSDVENFISKGINIVHDTSINPLKDMDAWTAQVAACDAVVSVANTTIHGSGGLNIPTHCLLSIDSDWRWLKSPSVTRSYWYPSVAISRQSPDRSWSQALSFTRNWLNAGASYPNGPQWTSHV
tara:strand:- start:3388 stop:5145 length:1758 start_codon:yes stop_codon:yes gene_type:complete